MQQCLTVGICGAKSSSVLLSLSVVLKCSGFSLSLSVAMKAATLAVCGAVCGAEMTLIYLSGCSSDK